MGKVSYPPSPAAIEEKEQFKTDKYQDHLPGFHPNREDKEDQQSDNSIREEQPVSDKQRKKGAGRSDQRSVDSPHKWYGTYPGANPRYKIVAEKVRCSPISLQLTTEDIEDQHIKNKVDPIPMNK